MFEIPEIIEGVDFDGYLPFKILCWLIGHKWKYYYGSHPARACLRCACYEWEKVK